MFGLAILATLVGAIAAVVSNGNGSGSGSGNSGAGGSNSSTATSGNTISYAAPTVSDVNAVPLDTSGGVAITIDGEHFGPGGADNGYATIPHKEEWKGISVYIPKSDSMEDHFTLDMILDLDIDTDIVYHIDTGVTIINNSSVGCKRLILEIIQESKPEYLDNFYGQGE